MKLETLLQNQSTSLGDSDKRAALTPVTLTLALQQRNDYQVEKPVNDPKRVNALILWTFSRS